MIASRRLTLFFLSLLAFTGLSMGFRSGPPAFLTNAPGDSNCTVCHFGSALNSGASLGFATFEVSGPPTLLDVAGPAATISVGFPFTTRPLHGFEMTVRDGDDQALSPSWAGQWESSTFGSNVQFAFNNQDYVSHSFSGTFGTNWSVGWLPPQSPPAGPITVYATGNAADGNGANSGDFIFADTHVIYQARCSTATTWPMGTIQPVVLEAPTVPGHIHVLVLTDDASVSTPLGGPHVVPLNVLSPLGLASFDPVNAALFMGFVGALDGIGNATAQVAVPNLAVLSGLDLHLAFATFVPGTSPIQVSEVSNRATVTIQ